MQSFKIDQLKCQALDTILHEVQFCPHIHALSLLYEFKRVTAESHGERLSGSCSETKKYFQIK